MDYDDTRFTQDIVREIVEGAPRAWGNKRDEWGPELGAEVPRVYDAARRIEARLIDLGWSPPHATCEFCSRPAPADQFHPFWHDDGSPMASCDACIVNHPKPDWADDGSCFDEWSHPEPQPPCPVHSATEATP